MKKIIFILSCFSVIYSCSKKVSILPVIPPVVIIITGCDSIKQGLLKTTSDTVRLVSCLIISGCDSIRLGILKPNTQDTIRLLSCIKITGCDSVRLGVLKPNTQDTLRLLSCIKISGCDSIRFKILKPNNQDTLRLLSCLKISANDSMRLGLLNIGQKYQGGIIAYILQPNDPGFDVNNKHGIIAAISDQSNFMSWWNGSYVTTGATDTTIGTGLVNTKSIISKQGPIEKNYAAGIARAYKEGEYTDWYLPSKYELNKIYLNRLAIGGFMTINYWSSSEISIFYAWSQDFNDGVQSPTSKKSNGVNVRAIRAF